MALYIVFLKDSDSCFFAGEAESKDEAIHFAVENYVDKYPEECARNDLNCIFSAQEVGSEDDIATY